MNFSWELNPSFPPAARLNPPEPGHRRRPRLRQHPRSGAGEERDGLGRVLFGLWTGSSDLTLRPPPSSATDLSLSASAGSRSHRPGRSRSSTENRRGRMAESGGADRSEE